MKENSERSQGRGQTAVIIFVVLALAALTVAVLRVVTDDIVESITRTISLQYSEELNTQMTAHISSTIDYYFQELNTEFTALKLVGDLDEEKLQKYLADTEKNNSSTYLAFADGEGTVYEADGSYLGTMRISVLGQLLNGESYIVSDNITIGSESFILFGRSFEETVPMGDSSLCIGLMGMDDDDLAAHLILQSDYSGGYASIIHKDGSYVFKNQAETKSGLNVFSILEKTSQVSGDEMTALKEAIDSGETYFLNVDLSDSETGTDEYLYFAPIEGTEWYIVNTLPSEFIRTSLLSMRNTMEIVYLSLACLLLLVGGVIILQQMVSSARLAKGQAELEKALRTAEEASSAKTSFLFNMSHDIRTPMNAILGYTDIGLKHVDDRGISEDSYKKIKAAGGHLLSLINDILEMSRIESGKMTLNEQPLDVREAIASITVMSQSLAVPRNIDYDTVIGEIRNPHIFADELHINEVIINLISNAIKYTPEGGRVRYTISQTELTEDGRAVYRFEVSDNGIGMSEEFQTHLFETFQREKNTTMSKIEGTGLGLSIVKRIVDLAGGTIRVHSVQNEGSTFTVEIPFRIPDEQTVQTMIAEKQQAVEPTEDGSLAGKRVLLVEDNELNREIATFILEDAGMDADTAEDGSLAVAAVVEKGTDYYDFILMDIQMPVMDGYEATRKIRELPGGERVPIIALSANAFEEDRKKSLEAGMNAHVAKPIDAKKLTETMQGLTKQA